jgi:hypothetical protein
VKRALPLLVTVLTGCTFYISGNTGDAGSSGSDTSAPPDSEDTTIDASAIDTVSPPLGDASSDSLLPPFDGFINLDGLIPPLDGLIPTFDAPPMPDAGSTSTLIETIQVPCNGMVVTSVHTYASGTTYRVRASGQCKVDEFLGADILADAEYQGTTIPRDKDSGVDTGIALYDTTLGFDKQPHWGAYTATHVYEITGPGFDVPVTVRYHDKSSFAYGNNSGSLTIEIFGP